MVRSVLQDKRRTRRGQEQDKPEDTGWHRGQTTTAGQKQGRRRTATVASSFFLRENPNSKELVELVLKLFGVYADL